MKRRRERKKLWMFVGLLAAGLLICGAAVGEVAYPVFEYVGVGWIVVFPDTDGDGILDIQDPDDDNDGLSDSYEKSIGTNYVLNNYRHP